MTPTLPSYLRVHHETTDKQSTAKQNAALDQPNAKDSVNDFWHAYQQVTGWRIDADTEVHAPKSRAQLRADIAKQKPNSKAAPAVNKLSAQRLADSAKLIANELNEAYETIRIQNAELAARSSILADSERQSQADLLSETLSIAATASQCDAAAIYLLDDDTQHLTLRSMHGLPSAKLSDAPRELRGSRGDLEAMVQGIVSISDLNELSVDTWNCPETASSAICAAITQAGVPIGTLWLFFREMRSLEESHSAVARLVANQVACQLQLATAEPTSQTTASPSNIDDLAQWQFAGLPMGTQLTPDWRVDGMIESPQPWATGWHAWDVLPDGSLMIAIAEADDKSVAGSMTAAIARSALESHTGYRHTPQQLLQRISDTLWQTNTMDQLTSLMYVRIDPETGEGSIATAGNMIAMIASRYGYRPAVQQNDSPLASQMDVNCTTSTFQMTSGEVLMGYGSGFAGDNINQMTIGNHLRQSMRDLDTCPLASIRRFLADKPLGHERGAVTILRQ